jgi:hypothetical protein
MERSEAQENARRFRLLLERLRTLIYKRAKLGSYMIIPSEERMATLEEFMRGDFIFSSYPHWPTDEQIEAERSSRRELEGVLTHLDAEGCLRERFTKFSLSRIDALISEACARLLATECGVIVLDRARKWSTVSASESAEKALKLLELITSRTEDCDEKVSEAIDRFLERGSLDSIEQLEICLAHVWDEERALVYMSDATVKQLREWLGRYAAPVEQRGGH